MNSKSAQVAARHGVAEAIDRSECSPELELIDLLFGELDELFHLARDAMHAAIAAALDAAHRTAGPDGRVRLAAAEPAFDACEAAQAVVLKMAVMHGKVAKLTDVRKALAEREQVGQFARRH
jgi:hypothetical protein